MVPRWGSIHRMSLQLNHLTVTSAPLPAATVVMLRDTPDGLQVLLLKRHAASGVLGGAYVFPGGKVDADDAIVDAAAHLDETPRRLHAALGEPMLAESAAVAIHVAAIREAFEESGVLFADAAGATADVGSGLADLRRAPGFAFRQLLANQQLRLRTRDLTPWSRWITPPQPTVTNRRFDTRFFVARVGSSLEVRLDDVEAVASLWLTPADALARYWRRELVLAAPQIMSLSHLARHASAESVIAEAQQRGVRLIEPHICEVDGHRVTCYPGDPMHPVPVVALPGPSRLVFRDGRFEPDGGLAALHPG